VGYFLYQKIRNNLHELLVKKKHFQLYFKKYNLMLNEKHDQQYIEELLIKNKVSECSVNGKNIRVLSFSGDACMKEMILALIRNH
jgi:hypothetical protein